LLIIIGVEYLFDELAEYTFPTQRPDSTIACP
jgi:hypothetical protein